MTPFIIYSGVMNSGTAFTVTGTTQAGDAILVTMDMSGTATSVTDTQGNTYIAVETALNGNAFWLAAYKGSPGISTVALTAGGDKITVNGTSGGGLVAGVRGVARAGPDKAPASTHTTTGSPSGPATGV